MFRSFRTQFALVMLAFALAACAPAQVGPSTGSAALPTAAPPTVPVSTPEPVGLRPMQVHNVEVQIGVGSPIPVDVFVSGEWPDLCAQLAEIRQHVESGKIEITLLASPADPNCPPDHLGLPFRIAVPLNIVSLLEGTYTVVVNGVSTTFVWPSAPTITPEPIILKYRNTTVGFEFGYPAGWVLDEAGDTDILWSQRPTAPGTEGVPEDIVKIDISGESNTVMTLEELVARQKQGIASDQIRSEEELTLPSGLRAVRMQVSAFGDSVTLMTIINGHPVVLIGFGDLSRFDEVARWLRPSQ